MNNELIPFAFEAHDCPVIMDDQGNPWWIAKNVCEILGLGNTAMALDKLDEDEKLISKLLISGQNRDVWLINESGLWSLIMRSNKPEAKRLKKWVTSEVLPAIRKTGHYGKATEQINPAAQSRFVFFNQPNCAVVLADLRQCLSANTITREEFRHILLEEKTVNINDNPIDAMLGRFIRTNVIFSLGEIIAAHNVYNRFRECGGPSTIGRDQLTRCLLENLPGFKAKPKHRDRYGLQTYYNIRLTAKAVPINNIAR
jgi:Prophage antirepressor